jgi:ribonuclease D
MIIRRTISKEEIREMPRATFSGRIYVVQSEAEAVKAVNYLKTQSLVGIDSETRPSFRKGQLHKVALLQVSSEECCFLFRLNMIGLPTCLVNLLEDADTVKVGLSLKDDFMMLRKRAAFSERGVIELQQFVRLFGIEDMSLQKIYALLFKEKISKSQQLTNWETDVLSDGQKLYAATDAWACLNIYKLLKELQRTGDFEIEQSIEDNKSGDDKQENN